MERRERLMPVAVRDTMKLAALGLVIEGYDQSNTIVKCNFCEATYLLLFDPTDNDRMQPSGSVHKAAVDYFIKRISEDHFTNHQKPIISW